jgi:predicted naringenin-chalcone synthase
MYITDFQALNPKHVIGQAQSLAWLAEAHARSEATLARREGRVFEEAPFRRDMERRLSRFGCGPDQIATRGHEIADCAHTRWPEMEVYRLDERPEGEGMLARTRAFEGAAEGILSRLYAERDTPPADLVHVTCTGYVSPSAAQSLVSRKGWGPHTRVTHAYHMGCYAALPAVRVASAFASSDGVHRSSPARRSEIVHTEICSLHLNPMLHNPEQLVVQTLFADGFIGYAVCDQAARTPGAPALELLSLSDTMAPDSTGAMTWLCSDWGFQMSLARDVPERLAEVLSDLVDRVCQQGGLTADERAHALYAMHPGGPRILDRMRDVLGLGEEQIAFSRRVLLEHGNMSSATLPHVWMDIARDAGVEPGRAVVSLAFGPGLTLCGAAMRKVAP